MLRRTICCLMCLLLLPALCIAESTFSMAGFDGQDSTHDWATNQFFQRMQDATGITFTYQQYVDESKWQAAKDAMLAGGELPDVLFKAALDSQELIALTDAGKLIDLKPLLAENAPNLWALLQANPDWMEAVTLPSGMIGALPALQTQSTQNAMWINKVWLERLKLDMPTDLDSLRAVLAAFRDGDPNQNNRQDEIPLAFLGPWDLKFLSHAFGVVANDYNVYVDDAGKVCYWPLEDSFIELARVLRGFQADGLLDKNGFQTADTLRRVTEEDAVATYGVFFAPTPVSLLPFTQATEYALLEPLVFGGAQVYRDMGLSVTRGTFAITSACADPAALLKWVDTLYTEAGATAAMVGNDGDVYIEKENGLWGWKGGTESMSSTVLNELSIYDTGDMPWLFPQGFYERYDDDGVRAIYAELHKLDAFTKQPFPAYTLTAEQRAEALPLQNALGQYVDETLAKIVLGEAELDDMAVAAFRDGLKERGAEELTAFWQRVYDAR